MVSLRAWARVGVQAKLQVKGVKGVEGEGEGVGQGVEDESEGGSDGDGGSLCMWGCWCEGTGMRVRVGGCMVRWG